MADDSTDYAGPDRRKPHTPTTADTDAIRQAVADGIREAVSDPALWEAAGKAMREQAQSAAGGWLLGGLRTLLNRLGWALLIVAGIYTIGGWPSVVAFLKTGGKP